MPGWFDIFDWPIGVGCQNDEDGLKRSVETIHDCVRDLEAKGVDKSRIVIGGFSQGGKRHDQREGRDRAWTVGRRIRHMGSTIQETGYGKCTGGQRNIWE